ncbi:alanine racemase [Streptomyces sp. NBC_00893]|uniref:alanine racemase n=1 Tax=Streptomyces sp. NBC_00893 TaxID=2975862 RepID=UPI00225A1EC4|nr:alanine racemase [Streptomyces sp. NBC_00893]MCX4850443.1 alanine racemase [Streptomyces sp. NBC_00893]
MPLTSEQLQAINTPAYVYDLAELRANWRRLRTMLPEGTGLFYSMKSNPHPEVVRELRIAGAAVEVCSRGEVASAIEAGWPASELLYGGPGKRDEDLEEALRCGVRQFSVDSPAALDQIDRLAGALGLHCRAILRINDAVPTRGQGLAMSGRASQFGADVEWVVAEPQAFSGRKHVTVEGIHCYMGTNYTEADDLVAQFSRSLTAAMRATEALTPHGMCLHMLDLGGGFGAPFARAGGSLIWNGLAARVASLLDEVVPGWRRGAPYVTFESGRYLTATAGTLFTKVLDVKQSHGTTVVVVDSGINHLGGMAGLRRVPPLLPTLVRADGKDPAANGSVTVPTLVAGPLCTPLDTWARSTPLPPLELNDILAVPNVGAYGLYASLVAFLGHPLPIEVIVDSERPDLEPSASRLELVRSTNWSAV